jgi:hypothetical protein
MGAKLKSKTHLQNTVLDFLTRFLRIRLQSLEKVLIWPKKFFLLKKSEKMSKNAEFHADFKSVEKVVKKCTKKSYKQKVWRTWVKSEKGLFPVTFLLITFLWCILSNFFQRIRNQLEILRFLIPIYSIYFSTFCKLWLQMRRKRLKKTENLFLWMCLRILLGNHQSVCISKLLKSLYPIVHMLVRI